MSDVMETMPVSAHDVQVLCRRIPSAYCSYSSQIFSSIAVSLTPNVFLHSSTRLKWSREFIFKQHLGFTVNHSFIVTFLFPGRM